MAYRLTANGSTLLYNVNYGTRDALGRIVHKDETIQGQAYHFDYGYDANGRLINVFNGGIAPGSVTWASSATYSVGQLVSYGGVEYASLQSSNTNREPDISATWWSVTQTYSYDQNGNRLTGPNLSASPSYDAQDRLLSYANLSGGNCTYLYKADGSLQTKTCGGATTTYDYDAFSNLRKVTLPNGTSYGYLIDGQNRRVGKKVNGALVEGFLYQSQLKPAAWLNGDGSVRAIFVYGLHANVPEYMVQGGTTYRLIVDQVGSVRLVENTSTGALAERIDYDEFGNALSDTAPGTQPFGFAGGLRDLDTGLTRFGARDYDPVTGRWTAKDPLRFGGGLTSLYSYVGGDAINRKDPRGLDILVIEGGPTEGNPIGHSAIGITGQGVYSFGTVGTQFGMSLDAYLLSQLSRRDTSMFLIKTSPDQDAAALAFLRSASKHIDVYTNNCSSRVNGALDAAGIPHAGASTPFGDLFAPPDNVPGSAGFRAAAAGAQQFGVPMDSFLFPLDPSLNQFNSEP